MHIIKLLKASEDTSTKMTSLRHNIISRKPLKISENFLKNILSAFQIQIVFQNSTRVNGECKHSDQIDKS